MHLNRKRNRVPVRLHQNTAFVFYGGFEMYTSKRKHRFLSPTERVKIELWHKEGLSQAEIARRLGVHRSTICRELKVGRCQQLDGQTWTLYESYSADLADQKHKYAQTSKGADLKIGNRYDYLNAIQERVLQNGSFEEALLYLDQTADFGISISKQTAYRYLQMGLFSKLKYSDLPCPRNKKHRRKVQPRRNATHPDHRSIEHRSVEIDVRSAVGHWEMDSIIGKAKGKKESCLVLSERKAREGIILYTEGKTADATIRALKRLRRAIGPDFSTIFKTITCDNGSEFADQQGMEIDDTLIYYCHPSCPSERGTNENMNRLVRRKLPKGKSLSRFTPKQAKEVQRWLNDYRRPILGGRCAQEVFFEELDKLPLKDPDRVKAFFR